MSTVTLNDRRAEQERALTLLREASRFVLCGHMRPDGDCIGAQAALSRVLTKLGKQVWIFNPDAIQPQLDYLAKDTQFRVYDGGALPVHDVAVMLDFNELERTGALAKPLAAAPSRKLVIDHHLFHATPWWNECYVDPSAAATGLLVYRIARELGVALDPVIARGVYTSLVTDTGWFKYSNTDAETFAVAGELVASGVEPSVIFNSIYQRNSREHPLGIARALQRLEYFAEGRIALIDLPQAVGTEVDLLDSDDVLDIVRAVGRVEVVLFVRELKDGTVKLSARSKGAFDVNALARQFGGGGHAKASGATVKGLLSEVRGRIADAALAQLAAPA